jgi:DNA repair ATPase RecN
MNKQYVISHVAEVDEVAKDLHNILSQNNSHTIVDAINRAQSLLLEKTTSNNLDMSEVLVQLSKVLEMLAKLDRRVGTVLQQTMQFDEYLRNPTNPLGAPGTSANLNQTSPGGTQEK